VKIANYGLILLFDPMREEITIINEQNEQVYFFVYFKQPS